MQLYKKGARSGGTQLLSRSLRMYQKIAVVFVVFSLLLLFVVLYLSVSEAVIRVVSKRDVVSVTSGVEIVAQPNAYGQVSGFVVERVFEKGRVFALPEEGGKPVERNAIGRVTLINETSSRVDLVANTRLLSRDGVLFRLSEAATIAPNAQVEVSVFADQPGKSGEIGPSRFTIPGLPASSQAVVYAVSVDAMTGGVQYVRALTQKDLDDAERVLKDEILEEVKGLLRGEISVDRFDGEVYEVSVVSKQTDGVLGTEQGAFTASVAVKVVAIYYPRSLVRSYVAEQLYEAVQDGFELVHVHVDGMQVSVDSVNAATEVANLHVYLDGEVVLASHHESLDVGLFKRKNAEEVKEMLRAVPLVEEVDISFTPFWLKRVPILDDHIRVDIRPLDTR